VNPSSRHPLPHIWTLLTLVAAGGAVAAGALVWRDHKPAVTPPAFTNNAEAPAKFVPPQPPATPSPDPNFVRVPPLKFPGITSPEAERVVLDMQSAYRCLHTGSQRALAAWLPPSAGDGAASMEELSASMRQSLAKLPDACYVTTALPQIVNRRTPATLLDVLYKDLARRPDPIKLRTLFLIAGLESHPKAANALEDLQTLLNTDCQRDWQRWDQAIAAQLVRESHGTRGVACRVH
jgi:hypothetical protein